MEKRRLQLLSAHPASVFDAAMAEKTRGTSILRNRPAA